MRRWLAPAVGLAGAVLIAIALGWWGIVYYGVFEITGLSMVESAPCMFYTSATCSLAMSLCGGDHLFGISRYSTDLLWAGIAMSSVAVLAGSFVRQR